MCCSNIRCCSCCCAVAVCCSSERCSNSVVVDVVVVVCTATVLQCCSRRLRGISARTCHCHGNAHAANSAQEKAQLTNTRVSQQYIRFSLLLLRGRITNLARSSICPSISHGLLYDLTTKWHKKQKLVWRAGVDSKPAFSKLEGQWSLKPRPDSFCIRILQIVIPVLSPKLAQMKGSIWVWGLNSTQLNSGLIKTIADG